MSGLPEGCLGTLRAGQAARSWPTPPIWGRGACATCAGWGGWRRLFVVGLAGLVSCQACAGTMPGQLARDGPARAIWVRGRTRGGICGVTYTSLVGYRALCIQARTGTPCSPACVSRSEVTAKRAVVAGMSLSSRQQAEGKVAAGVGGAARGASRTQCAIVLDFLRCS